MSSLSGEKIVSPLKRNRFASDNVHVSQAASDERGYEHLDNRFFEGIPDDMSQQSTHVKMPCLKVISKDTAKERYFLSPFKNYQEDLTDTQSTQASSNSARVYPFESFSNCGRDRPMPQQENWFNRAAPEFMPIPDQQRLSPIETPEGKAGKQFSFTNQPLTPREAQNEQAYEPAYKKKEKTELCKNWQKGDCKFGDACAFAHGIEDLVKRTHVASRYKVTLCKTYHAPPYVCQYGYRCQFAHLTRDFSGSNELEPSHYAKLLIENARIMMDRINGVADPDINVFNVAKPDKARLSVFSQICPIDVAQPEFNIGLKRTQRGKRRNSVRGQRSFHNQVYYDYDECYEDFDFAYQANTKDLYSKNPFMRSQPHRYDFATYGSMYE